MLFHPLRLTYFPQTSSMAPGSGLIFLINLLVFPIAGFIIIIASVPETFLKGKGYLDFILFWLFFGFGVFAIVQHVRFDIRLSREAREKAKVFWQAYEDDIKRVKEESLAAKTTHSLAGFAGYDAPYIVFESRGDSGELPSWGDSLNTADGWISTVFGEEILKKVEAFGTALGELPEFDCRYAFIIVYGKEESGRKIYLDSGSVPEIRAYAEAYMVDLKIKWRVKIPGRVSGPRAHKPARKLGSGTIYLSKLEGDKPKYSKVWKHIKKYLKKID